MYKKVLNSGQDFPRGNPEGLANYYEKTDDDYLFYTGWVRAAPLRNLDLFSEDDGVFIAYSSIHGHTKEAAFKMKEILEEKGAKKVAISDLTRDDMAEAIEDAFRYDKIILASSSYNMGLFPAMEQFLHHLQGKNYQNRKIGIIENGTWAPSAGKCMKEIISQMKDINLCNTTVTIMSKMNNENIENMKNLADELLNN